MVCDLFLVMDRDSGWSEKKTAIVPPSLWLSLSALLFLCGCGRLMCDKSPTIGIHTTWKVIRLGIVNLAPDVLGLIGYTPACLRHRNNYF